MSGEDRGELSLNLFLYNYDSSENTEIDLYIILQNPLADIAKANSRFGVFKLAYLLTVS